MSAQFKSQSQQLGTGMIIFTELSRAIRSKPAVRPLPLLPQPGAHNFSVMSFSPILLPARKPTHPPESFDNGNSRPRGPERWECRRAAARCVPAPPPQ